MPAPSERFIRKHEQFVDLVCADPAWVRAEFESIMAAEYERGGWRPSTARSTSPAPSTQP
jgi:hypothetical protein